MENKGFINQIFSAIVICLALCAALLLIIPFVRLIVDSVTVLLRAWGVLPGISVVIMHTLQLLIMVIALVLPLALAVTLYLFWLGRKKDLHRVTRLMEGFSRCPAVLIGLVGNWVLGQYVPLHDSMWSMAILLTFMFLPFMISRMNAALHAVPDSFHAAGMALGGSEHAVLFHIILPEALPQIVRAVLRLAERILCEATVLLVMLGTVVPNQVLATELFRLSWLGRKDAVVLALMLAAITMVLRLATARKWNHSK